MEVTESHVNKHCPSPAPQHILNTLIYRVRFSNSVDLLLYRKSPYSLTHEHLRIKNQIIITWLCFNYVAICLLLSF